MSNISKLLYPECQKEDSFSSPDDYGPLLQSLGVIIVRVDDDDYQGDSRVMYVDGDRFGYLRFGWGSCSGCDALQSCSSYKEIEALRNELARNIVWKESAKEMLDWMSGRDWMLAEGCRETNMVFARMCDALLNRILQAENKNASET